MQGWGHGMSFTGSYYSILVIIIRKLWSREPPCTPTPTDLRRRLQRRRVARRPLCSKGRLSQITLLNRASQLPMVASYPISRPSSLLYYRHAGLELRVRRGTTTPRNSDVSIFVVHWMLFIQDHPSCHAVSNKHRPEPAAAILGNPRQLGSGGG